MADLFFNPIITPIRIGSPATATATTNFAIDSVLIFGTSGDSISFDYMAREAASLTDFYFFTTAIAGTLGNIQVTCEVRNDSGGNPSTTIHATQTTTCNGAGTWSRVTFASPYTFVMGTRYHILLHNTSIVPTTDFPTIARISTRYAIDDSNDLTARSSTNGTSWTGGTTSKFVGVLKFSGLPAIGNPYTSVATNYTSNSRERGFYIATRPVALNVFEFRPNPAAVSAINGGKILLSATGSSAATPGAGEYAGVYESTNKTIKFGADAIMLAAQAYRLVFTFSGNSVNPLYFQIDDSGRYADVLAAAYLGGTVHATIGDGSGGWTDSPAVMPCAEVLLRGVGAEASVGGGMMVNPGTSGRII